MKKLMIIIVLILAVGASAFAYMQHTKDEKIAEMHAPLLASLKDPESAQFRNEHYGSDGEYLCGEVNSKNGMGGYVGFRRFISTSSNFALDGYSVSSIDVEATTRRVDMEIAIMKKEKRIPTDEEVDRKMFEELWRKVAC